MSCRFDREIIQKYADNTIDPLEFIFLKEHISYCEECRKELDLVMTLENEMDKFFNDNYELKDLDLSITKLVDNCMYEVNKTEKLKYIINMGIRMGNGIIDNSLRFINYVPGSKRIGKGVRKTASITRNILVVTAKNKIGKLLANVK